MRLEVQIPYHDKRAMTHSPSPRAWGPDFPGATQDAPLFIGGTDAEAEAVILWPSDVKSQSIGKNPDAGKN